ncbi:cell division protein ZapA [Staphylococcus rostri]|uniref:cell division protein ZapA n=1 Tax=Staphylococcus rostri TaxID=522262 RepID=UPI002852D857|nr:cell division protein ZapA [Staphylococcus rostri]
MGEFKNRINVTINDQHYTIVGEDDPEHIRYVADLVDTKIRELGSRNAGLDSVRKSVLTAVNVMHELVLLEEENARLREEIQRLKHQGN